MTSTQKYGGARAGSGRKRRVPGEASTVVVQAMVTPTEARYIDIAAGACGISRSAWIAAAISARLPKDR